MPSGNLVATVWKDKKDVKMLSTMCDPCSSQTVERKQKDGGKVTIPCPHAAASTWEGLIRGINSDNTTASGQNV